MVRHGLTVRGTRFWVTHRGESHGPFDYEWSADFCGVELMFQNRKFGEYCSLDEIFADLKQFHLPMTVVRVASIVLGCIVYGVLNGLPEAQRFALIQQRLLEFGYERFLGNDPQNDADLAA